MIVGIVGCCLSLFLSDKGAFQGWFGGLTDYRLPATDHPFISCTTYFSTLFFYLPASGGNPVNLSFGFMEYAISVQS